MSITLFYARGACSMAPHIGLYESGLPFSTEAVDLRAKKWQGGDYFAINEKGAVPALKVEDGEILTEVAVILQYIANQVPSKNLLPPFGEFARYRCLEWVNFIATELHKGFSPMFKTKDEAVIQNAKENVMAKLAFVNKKLEGKKFLCNDEFTIADAYMFVPLTWASPQKLDLSKFSAIQSYLEHLRQRPSVQKALKAEGILK